MAKAQPSPQGTSRETEFLGAPAMQLLGQLSLLLVKEHLFPLKQQYDDALRSLSKDYPTPALYHDQQKATYTQGREECREQLSLCLYGEFEAMLTSAIAEMELWPTTSIKPDPADASGANPHESKQPPTAAASADKVEEESLFVSQSPTPGSPRLGSTSGATAGPFTANTMDDNTRSKTTATPAAPNKQRLFSTPQPAWREIPSSSTHHHTNQDMPGPSTGTKRPAVCMEDFFSSTKSSLAKKPKSPSKPESKFPMAVPKPFLETKKNITMAEVHDDECVHHFEQHRGLYVLRCNLTACKKAVASTNSTLETEDGKKGDFSKLAVYFTANPLASHRALDHFRRPGHNINKINKIYERYAIRVVDATEDRNMGDLHDRSPCIKLGETHSTKATQVNGPSILKRTFGGAAKDSNTVKHRRDSESYQSSPTPPRHDNLPVIRSPASGSGSTSSVGKTDPLSTTSPPSEEAWRKRPKRAAASAVTTYGPFAISDDEGGDFSRRQPKPAMAHVAPEADISSRRETIAPTNLKPNGKGKATPDLSFNPSGTLESESDDSDSSIPASLQRMRELQSRMV